MSEAKLSTCLAVLLLGLSASLQAQSSSPEVPAGLPVQPPQQPVIVVTDGPGLPPAPVVVDAPVPPPPPSNSLDNGSPFSAFAAPGFTTPIPMTTFRILAAPSEGVGGQAAHLSFLQTDLASNIPLWQNEKAILLATVHVRNEEMDTGAVLPLSGQPFPNELWDIRLGLTGTYTLDNGWTLGGSVNGGSASDKPFHSINEITEGFNTFLRVPQGEHNAWLFSLSYSPTSQLAFPLPGVAYLWQPTDNFRAILGLPLQLMYRPIDALTLDFSYMLLTTVRARATYRLTQAFRLYAGYDAENYEYFLADREDVQDRFFSYDQRVSGGVQYFLNQHVSFDLSSGYLFDRYYYEGHSGSSDTTNRVNVGDAPFVAFQGRIKW